MKIYDCFIYFDEELLLDVRLNVLDKFIHKFVIVESRYSHRGEKREPSFEYKKFNKFKNKIEYILLDDYPKNLHKINKDDKQINENQHKSMNIDENTCKSMTIHENR